MAIKLNIKKIEFERKRLNLSKGELANIMKVSNPIVSYIYKSKSVRYADKLAKVFNMDPKDLII